MKLISRNNSQVIQKFSKLHSVVCAHYGNSLSHIFGKNSVKVRKNKEIFRQFNFIVICFVKTLLSRNFAKKCEMHHMQEWKLRKSIVTYLLIFFHAFDSLVSFFSITTLLSQKFCQMWATAVKCCYV